MQHEFPNGHCLRDAWPSDLASIVEIYNSTIVGRTATADTDPVAVKDRRAWFEQHSRDRRPLWVLVDYDERVVGWLSLQDFSGRPAYVGTAELSVYVRESLRGSGVGSLLLDRALA